MFQDGINESALWVLVFENPFGVIVQIMVLVLWSLASG